MFLARSSLRQTTFTCRTARTRLRGAGRSRSIGPGALQWSSSELGAARFGVGVSGSGMVIIDLDNEDRESWHMLLQEAVRL